MLWLHHGECGLEQPVAAHEQTGRTHPRHLGALGQPQLLARKVQGLHLGVHAAGRKGQAPQEAGLGEAGNPKPRAKGAHTAGWAAGRGPQLLKGLNGAGGRTLAGAIRSGFRRVQTGVMRRWLDLPCPTEEFEPAALIEGTPGLRCNNRRGNKNHNFHARIDASSFTPAPRIAESAKVKACRTGPRAKEGTNWKVKARSCSTWSRSTESRLERDRRKRRWGLRRLSGWAPSPLPLRLWPRLLLLLLLLLLLRLRPSPPPLGPSGRGSHLGGVGWLAAHVALVAQCGRQGGSEQVVPKVLRALHGPGEAV